MYLWAFSLKNLFHHRYLVSSENLMFFLPLNFSCFSFLFPRFRLGTHRNSPHKIVSLFSFSPSVYRLNYFTLIALVRAKRDKVFPDNRFASEWTNTRWMKGKKSSKLINFSYRFFTWTFLVVLFHMNKALRKVCFIAVPSGWLLLLPSRTLIWNKVYVIFQA